jgi:hypothetical protein
MFDLLGIGLRVFFYSFLSTRLSQFYIHGRRVSGLTQIDLDPFFWIVFFYFFQFHASIFDCLIIKFHCFIQPAFNIVTIVSWPGHGFDILTKMGFFTFFSLLIFLFVYLFLLYLYYTSLLNSVKLITCILFIYLFCFLKNRLYNLNNSFTIKKHRPPI